VHWCADGARARAQGVKSALVTRLNEALLRDAKEVRARARGCRFARAKKSHRGI
jgi:hypothetical protein